MKRYQDTDYYITENGEIWSRKCNKLKQLKPTLVNWGYLRIGLMIDGKQIPKLVHRLVGETFISNPENYPQINHKDGNKTNNHISNLEWCDNGHNQKHAYQIGLNKPTNGEKHWHSKLTEQQVLEIRELYSTKNYTQKELGKKFGIRQFQISRIINNKLWKHI